MPDDERPSLEAPQLFGRRRGKRAAKPVPTAPTDDAQDVGVFEDSGRDTATDTDTAVLPVAVDETDETAETADEGSPARRTRRRTKRTGPLLPGRLAAPLTGAVVGLALLGFTWLGFRTCEAARGTTSCGTAPGMIALVVIFVLAVIVGGTLLSQFAIPDPGPTAFLGTGITGIFFMLAVDYLDNWSVLLVVPAVCAGGYLVSWWLATTFVDLD